MCTHHIYKNYVGIVNRFSHKFATELRHMIDSIFFLLPILSMNGQNLTKCSYFGGIPPVTSELAALERLKNLYISLKVF